MKKILIVFFGILMLFGSFVNAAQNVDIPTKSDNLDITMISQIPDSAEPGK